MRFEGDEIERMELERSPRKPVRNPNFIIAKWRTRTEME
jgi:hypothetical protein